MRAAAIGAFVCLAVAGCAHSRRPPEPRDELAGLELPLLFTGGLRAVVEGELGETAAFVVLDVAQPLSRVTEACFAEELPSSEATVRIPVPSGGHESAQQISFSGVRVGGRRIGELSAALQPGDSCEVTLGSDVLGAYALQLDPQTRTVRILPSRTREDWAAQAQNVGASGSDELHLLELLRDPGADWPLIAARVRQGDEVLTGPFIVSTGADETRIGAQVARRAGLQPGPAFLRELGIPAGVKLPEHLGGNALAADRFELSPGFGFDDLTVRLDQGWDGTAVVGVLGGDVWGRFKVTVDPAAGVLALERPKVIASGSRQRCATEEGQPREEACFVLHQQPEEDGVAFVTTVWRDLPEGARVYLDALDAGGQPLSGMCRLGVTFPPTDRGVSAAHRIPWEEAAKSVPECAAELAQARAVRFSLLEEAPLAECPGTCAFAQGLLSERVSCQCVGSGFDPSSEVNRRFMQMYEDVLKRRPELKPAPAGSDEPADPE